MQKINETRFKRAFDKSFSTKARQIVRNSRIIEKYLAGIPLSQIANDYKITTASIGNIINQHPKKETYQKQRKERCAQLLSERNEHIATLAKQGNHPTDIAKHFNLTQRQIHEILSKSGTKTTSKKKLGVRALAQQELHQQNKKRILTAFIQGAPIETICAHQNITRRRFFQILKEMTLDQKFNENIYSALEKRMRQALGLFGRGVTLQTIAERVGLPVGYLHQSLSKLKGYKSARKKHHKHLGQWAMYNKSSMLEHAKFDESHWLQIIFNEAKPKNESQTHKARIKITEILGDLKHEKVAQADLFNALKQSFQISQKTFNEAMNELQDIGIIKSKGRIIQIHEIWKNV